MKDWKIEMIETNTNEDQAPVNLSIVNLSIVN